MHSPTRRTIMQWGAASGIAAMVTGAASVAACARTAPPRAIGWHMPVEDAPHERTFMQWPVSLDVYDRPSLLATQQAIARLANASAHFEPGVMLAAARHHAAARAQLSSNVTLWDVPTEDLWCRDSGPTFVHNAVGDVAVMDFNFNGWGNKQVHRHDGRIAAAIARRLGLPRIDSGVVGEQGGVEHDGAGLVLAHASSWVNPNRNRASAATIGQRLTTALGGTQMIWAPGVIGADITDYHIDSLARFVGPGKVVIQMPPRLDPDDPWSASAFQTMEILRSTRTANGQSLEIVTLPEPQDIRSDDPDFVSSYVNYYVCNGAVIAPEFGDARADAAARAVLASLYPGRQIVQINIDALGASGGGIHCATQQQPQRPA